MQTKPTIHQKINLRMAGFVVHYIVTKNRKIGNRIPTWLKSKSRYNSCYDFPQPLIPLDTVNNYINEKSDKLKEYLKSNLHRYDYLKVEVINTPIGLRLQHGLINEKPVNHTDMERTGIVRFVDVEDVELK